MSYYDIYLKRINRFGNTLQDRIQGKREHDFLTFMKKSPNLVRARNGETANYYDAILQTKEYDEDEVIDYLLVPFGEKIPLGTVIHTEDSRFLQERNWMNYAIDPYTSSGYDRYTIVELETRLSWVVNGVKYESLAHAIGGGSGERDKAINLKFKTQFQASGVYLPNKRYSIVMPKNEHIKKGTKVTFGEETWRVTGFDNVSIQGVSYITLEEYLTDQTDDVPVANGSQLENISVLCDLGENFTIPLREPTITKLHFYYQDEERNIPFVIVNNENYEYQIEDNNLTIVPKKEGLTNLQIVIQGWDNTQAINIPFTISAEVVDNFPIIGPKAFYMGEEVIYTFPNATEEDLKTIEISNDCAKIIQVSSKEKNVCVKGQNIGKSSIKIKYLNNSAEKIFNFEVQSLWLGGV